MVSCLMESFFNDPLHFCCLKNSNCDVTPGKHYIKVTFSLCGSYGSFVCALSLHFDMICFSFSKLFCY